MRPPRAALLASGLAAVLVACEASPDEDSSTASDPPFDTSRFAPANDADGPIDRRLRVGRGAVEAEALRDATRERFEERAQWTRAMVVSRTSALSDGDAASSRLFQNATDVADVLRPFYGSVAADTLETLLDQQVRLTLSVLETTAQHDDASLHGATRSAYENAHRIATLLAGLNPDWHVDDLDAMLRSELEATFAESAARVRGDWTADVAAHDDLVAHARSLADVLAGGIIAQLPDRVRPPVAVPDYFHERMREVWAARAAWTRMHLVSRLDGLPDEPALIGRLLQSGSDVARIFSDLYGADTGAALESLLAKEVYATSHWIDAIRSGDVAAAESARSDVDESRQAIVLRLADANGWLDAYDVDQKLRAGFDAIQRQARHRLRGSWAADVREADRRSDLFRALADNLTLGIEQQLSAVRL